MVKVGCGIWHSVCVCKSGSVYCWGRNEKGQCGIGSGEETKEGGESMLTFHSPTLVELPESADVVDIVCGAAHTIARVKNELMRCALGFSSKKQNTNSTHKTHTPRSKKEVCTCGAVIILGNVSQQRH